jgi:hypothetical protein
MNRLESGVFCAVHADVCARNNGYSNRGKVFSVWLMPGSYKQDDQ